MTNTINDQRLQQLSRRLATSTDYFLGFPVARDYDYRPLLPLVHQFLNNIGDPFANTWHTADSKDLECEVIDFFAQLFRAPAGGYWGYVTNGSTECNLYGLYCARERYPEAVVYYSAAAHYSIPKNIHLLGMTGIKVNAQPSGEMDYAHLRTLLAQHPDRPAVIVATVGTTMTEAKDNLAHIRRKLAEAGTKQHHLHVDAALAGPYAALLEPRHPFDFADGADSVGISGHKFIGSPMPSGVIIVRREHRERLGHAANYTGSIDSTISGSRNGHTPLFLWYAIQRWGVDGLRRRARESQLLAAYTHDRLQAVGWQTWRNPGALTVMIASPPDTLIRKWQLATADGWSHLICMPGVTQADIGAFIQDLTQTQATEPPLAAASPTSDTI